MDERSVMELDYLSSLMEEHNSIERSMQASASNLGADGSNSFHPEAECVAPEPCTEFQTARLLLSHLGLLHSKALRESLESPVPQLVALDSGSIDFVNDIEGLDRISVRTADTVNVFYMRSGQKNPEEILNNVVSSDY